MKKRILLCTGILTLGMMLPTAYAAPAGPSAKPATSQAIELSKPASLTFTTEKLKEGNVVGKYIKIKNLADAGKQSKINHILKADAKAILESLNIPGSKVTLDMNVKARYMKDTNLFVVTYSGYYNFEKSAHPANIYYVSVIDVSKASRMVYSNKSEFAKIKKAIQNGKFTVNADNKEVASAQKSYLKGLSQKELSFDFKEINFKYKKNSVTIPFTFMYKTKNTIELTLPAMHAIGDYINISINQKDLK